MLSAKRKLLVKSVHKRLLELGSCSVQSDCIYNSSGALNCQAEIMRCSKASIYIQSPHSSSTQRTVVVKGIVVMWRSELLGKCNNFMITWRLRWLFKSTTWETPTYCVTSVPKENKAGPTVWNGDEKTPRKTPGYSFNHSAVLCLIVTSPQL